jgi:hypothetical protein
MKFGEECGIKLPVEVGVGERKVRKGREIGLDMPRSFHFRARPVWSFSHVVRFCSEGFLTLANQSENVITRIGSLGTTHH